MQLRLESRPVGDVFVVQCVGRLVTGNEIFTLHSQVADAIEKYGDVVLQLERLDFVDSSGLGALLRLMQAARAKGGDLKLSGFPSRIHKMLELTHLSSQFEVYESLEEAITAAYLGSRYSRVRVETPDLAFFASMPRWICARFCEKYCVRAASTP